MESRLLCTTSQNRVIFTSACSLSIYPFPLRVFATEKRCKQCLGLVSVATQSQPSLPVALPSHRLLQDLQRAPVKSPELQLQPIAQSLPIPPRHRAYACRRCETEAPLAFLLLLHTGAGNFEEQSASVGRPYFLTGRHGWNSQKY